MESLDSLWKWKDIFLPILGKKMSYSFEQEVQGDVELLVIRTELGNLCFQVLWGCNIKPWCSLWEHQGDDHYAPAKFIQDFSSFEELLKKLNSISGVACAWCGCTSSINGSCGHCGNALNTRP